MASFSLANLRLDILSHVRVRGEDFPRPDPGAISDWFEIDVFTAAGAPVDLYPNQTPHPHPEAKNRLTIGWVGREAVPVFFGDLQVGTKRGGDFRSRFWRAIARRVAKAQLAARRGIALREVTEGHISQAPAALRGLLAGDIAEPLDLRAADIDAAVVALTGAAPRQGRRIPQGTVANIDADFDSESDGTTESETGIVARVSGTDASPTFTAQFRFPLSSIPSGARINDAVVQFNVTAENLAGSEGIDVRSYGTAGDDDPDTDTAANKKTKSNGGTTLVTITTSATGSKTGDLGTTADSEIQGNIVSPGRYSLGFNPNSLMDSGDSVSIEAIENSGSDPATLTLDYTQTVSLSGSQPAATGALKVKYRISLAGSQPSPSGAPQSKYRIAAVGAQPAPSGTISASQGPLQVTVTGNQPNATGALSVKYRIALAGSQLAPSGTLAEKYRIALSGSQPSAAGSLSLFASILLSGAQPAPSGALKVKYRISLTGSQPSASGTISSRSVVAVTLSGNQPAASGGVSLKYLIDLTGNQPAPTGLLHLVASIALSGTQPAPTGAVAARQSLLVDVAGSQPTSSGRLSVLIRVTLGGDQPAPSGSISASSGGLQVLLSGSQPAPAGLLSLKARITLRGNQPSGAGALAPGAFLLRIAVGVPERVTVAVGAEPSIPGIVRAAERITVEVTAMSLPTLVRHDAYRGDTFKLVVEFVDEQGAPLNIAGWSFTAQLRKSHIGSVVATFGIAVQGSEVTLSLPAATTAALEGRYVWDLQAVTAASETLTGVRGAIVWRADVTQPV